MLRTTDFITMQSNTIIIEHFIEMIYLFIYKNVKFIIRLVYLYFVYNVKYILIKNFYYFTNICFNIPSMYSFL